MVSYQVLWYNATHTYFCSLIGNLLYKFKWQWGYIEKYQSPQPDGGIDIFLLQKSRILDPWNYEIGLHADVSAWGCNNEILWLALPIPVGTCT